MAHFTTPYHRRPYPAISPSHPRLSQATRTVLITGGSAGIGFATARAFCAAGAARVVVLGRRADVLEKAVAELEAFVAARRKQEGAGTVVVGKVCDVAEQEAVESLWRELEGEGVVVDVVVLNAGMVGFLPVVDREKSLEGVGAVWRYFEVNVLTSLRMVTGLLGQGAERGKVVLNVSSAMAHMTPAGPQTPYAASKAGAASLLQGLADSIPVEELQIVNIHPGAVLTEAAKSSGYTEDAIPWDDVDLPAGFMVWAASKEAAFLHGRFVWANWDVNELAKMKDKISKDPGFLKIGLQGVDTLSTDFFDQVKALAAT